MGLLGDIYSTIDSKKRQLKGLLADPVETLKLGLLNFKNDQNALLDTQAQAYPFIPRTQDQQARIPTFARTQEQARKELADQGANMGMAAATVWHGSPHKFDKFDSSKIGTGEGAQAYGHGLYLAESPDVAKSYRDVLAGADKRFELGGRVVDPRMMDAFEANALQSLAYGQTPKQALANYEAQGVSSSALKRLGAILDDFNAKGVKVQDIPRENASLYKVDLPDEAIAKMLDWDKPLSQQAPEVQAGLKKYMGPEWDKTWDTFQGVNAYDVLANGRHGNSAGNIEAAKKLREAGIPGIRYLDGGSRGTGSGTSNYVVFPGNEDLLTILERNGQGLLGQ